MGSGGGLEQPAVGGRGSCAPPGPARPPRPRPRTLHPAPCTPPLCLGQAYAKKVADGYRRPLAHLPPGLAAIIADCWAADPASRPAAADVAARLAALDPAELGAGPGNGGAVCCAVM